MVLFIQKLIKKFECCSNFIKYSSKLLDDDNYYAQNLFFGNFAKDIEAYKAEKNLNEINSPKILFFLIYLGLSGESLDDSFSFLTKFFNKNLRPKKKLISLSNILISLALISLNN